MLSDLQETMTLTHIQVQDRAKRIAATLADSITGMIKIYPIPRGGIPAAYMVQSMLMYINRAARITEGPETANVFIDDIIDSGTTMQRYVEKYDGVPFFALVDKRTVPDSQMGWITFPWEGDTVGSFEDNVRRILQYVGEDVNRGGLLETPTRVAKAWRHWTRGYNQDPNEILKAFEDGGESYDEMVLVRHIPFYSHCEHHLAPFFGTADIAYIPNGRIVGLSKVSRLLDVFAARLQVQERLTAQVADALFDGLDAKGAAVSIRARHLCMESRGICKQGHETVTNALRGVFKQNLEVRAEFLATVK